MVLAENDGLGAQLLHQVPAVRPEVIAVGPSAAPEEGEERREVEDKEGKETTDDAEDGEVRKPRIGRRPALPTKAEFAEHLSVHLNYRSWCAHCPAGRARLATHICEPADREKLSITVSADFAFMGSEDAEEDMQPSLVVSDGNKEAFWAICVRTKTVTEQIVKYFKVILDQSGYEGEKISMKTDQEPSIIARKRAVAAARSGETVPIKLQVRASQSNGRMENAIGVWQGQWRTIKHYTEAMLKRRIEVDGVVFKRYRAFLRALVMGYVLQMICYSMRVMGYVLQMLCYRMIATC